MNQQKLIKKFLSNQCSAQEAEYIEQLLQKQPELLDEFLSEKEWQQHIDNYQQPATKKIMWIKALCLILLPLGFALLTLLPREQPAQPLAFQSYYHNQSDTIQSYVLADSSLIKLHPASKLYVQVTTDYPIRYVRVDQGTAKFAVAKNKYRPFVVEGGGLRTTALGTAFTVYVAPDHYQSSIQLEEGKVKVENVFASHAKSRILIPGEKVEFESIHNWYATKKPSKNTMLSKTNPKLEKLAPAYSYTRAKAIQDANGSIWMEDCPLIDALDFISYELDMPIGYIPQDLTTYKVAGRFIIKDQLAPKYKEKLAQDILQLITEVNPLELQKQHNTYILRNKN